MKSAFIAIDLQNDFLPGGALAVPEGDQVIPIINKIQAQFPLQLASKDWHPLNHGSFATNHPGHIPGQQIQLGGLSQTLWPVHCVQQSPGSDFAPGFDTSRVNRIFYKGQDPLVDSYSAFFDNGHRRDTGLGKYVQEKGIEQLFLAGLATDYCVKFSALDAIQLNIPIFVVRDACRAVNLNKGDDLRAWQEMQQAGIRLVQSQEIPLLLAQEALS